MRWRKALCVAKREYLAAVRTKGFIIGLAVAPIFMSGSVIVMALVGENVDKTDKHIAVIDRSGRLADGLIRESGERNQRVVYNELSGKKLRPAYVLEPVPPDDRDPARQRLELSDRVRNKSLHGFLEIGADVIDPAAADSSARITYYSMNAALDDARGWLENAVNSELRELRLRQAGVADSIAFGILIWSKVGGMGLASVDERTGAIQDARRIGKGEAIGIPLGVAALVYMMLMMGSVPLLSSVMEEKSQRIAEVLLGSVSPSEFMAGKVFGGVGVSLTASLFYVVMGVMAAVYLNVTQYIPGHVIPWLFCYVLLAVLMFGAINASLGAVCNDQKDAQNLTFPAMIPVILPLFVMVPVAKEPLSSFSTIASLIPPFVPSLMLARLCTPVDIPIWQPILGAVGLLICTIAAVWVGGRIFRIGILMQGKPPKLSAMLRWAIRG